MRALALADRPPTPDLRLVLQRRRPELVIVLGDLRADDLEALARFRGPKLGVHGNHDADDGMFAALEVDDLHGRVVEVGGLRFGGIEGCRRYTRGAPFEHTDREVARALRGMGRVDVLVTHCPPAGVNDDPGDKVHGGWPAMREHIERHPPRVLLHGHTYPTLPVEAVGRTAIRYVCGWRLVELPDP